MSAQQWGRVTFSTDGLPERDRLPVWREFYARKIVGVDWEPASDVPFRAEVSVQLFPGICLYRARCSPFRALFRPALVNAEQKSIYLFLPKTPYRVSQFGREIDVQGGEGVAISAFEASSVTNLACGDDRIGIAFSEERLKLMLPDVRKALMRRISSLSPVLQHLRRYVELLDEEAIPPEASELLGSVSEHLYELAALALAGDANPAEFSPMSTVAAARLARLKADIAEHCGDPVLSPSAVAKRHAISERYLRMLLAQSGTSFLECLRRARIERAHGMLLSSACRHLSITEIAFECGFSDCSHFNHVFRRAYDTTPSQIRAANIS